MANEEQDLTIASPDSLVREIATALQKIIHVQRLSAGSLIDRREFWQRCRNITPHWREPPIDRIFVDGFVGKCKSNSWKVYSDAIEEGLSLWSGYAFHGGTWWEHSWCMLGNRIIETTGYFWIYYGAEHTAEEREIFGKRYRNCYPPPSANNVRIYTFVNGFREAIPYDAEMHAIGFGRERDSVTGEIKEGLGR